MQQEFLLTRSNYYSQFFNTAIFFDPFRIYFNSAFESAALNLYYNVQKKMNMNAKAGTSYYILMYSDMALFEKSFGTTSENIVIAQEGNDYIIGLKSVSDLENTNEILKAIESIL